jgi:Zn-dependent protease with chaperone function
MFIVNPLQGAREDNEGFLANLLSTHPPLGRRIERLRALLNEAGGETRLAGPGAAPPLPRG